MSGRRPSPLDVDYEAKAIEAGLIAGPDEDAENHPTADDWPFGQRVDLGDLLTNGAPEADFLVDPVIPRGRVTLVAAKSGIGKTLFFGELAAAVATERRFLGETNPPARVMYCDYEMSVDDLVERFDAFGIGPDDYAALDDRLAYLLRPNWGPLDTDTGAAGLLAAVDEFRPDLVVIDTLSRVISGSENDADTFVALDRHCIQRLKARNVACALIDHAGHEHRRSRGSSAKQGICDLVWNISPTDDGIKLTAGEGTRIGWAPDAVLIHRTTDGSTPIHRRATHGGWPAGTAALAATLDQLGVPVDVSKRAARQALTAAGKSAADRVLLAAIKHRKQRPLEGAL